MTTPSIPTSQAFTHGFRHVQPRRLPSAAPRASIWRLPSAANPNRMNHPSRNRHFNMLD
ncbi:MAG: hypothetical protein PUI88_02800 [Prevotella sp.]|nr:hypothetical protein [Prevotella sp.]